MPSNYYYQKLDEVKYSSFPPSYDNKLSSLENDNLKSEWESRNNKPIRTGPYTLGEAIMSGFWQGLGWLGILILVYLIYMGAFMAIFKPNQDGAIITTIVASFITYIILIAFIYMKNKTRIIRYIHKSTGYDLVLINRKEEKEKTARWKKGI